MFNISEIKKVENKNFRRDFLSESVEYCRSELKEWVYKKHLMYKGEIIFSVSWGEDDDWSNFRESEMPCFRELIDLSGVKIC